MESERRAHGSELRLLPPEEGVRAASVLAGYAAVFGALSEEMGPPSRRFRERILPGAFRGALESVGAGSNVFAYWHHGLTGGGPHSAMPLGSTRDGSLRLQEDAHGLLFDLDLPDTSDGRDLGELVRRGTVRGASFAFPVRAARDTWHQDGGQMVRTIHEVRALIDVSPTHIPAYPDTALAVRSLEEWEERARNASTGELSYEHQQAAVWAALRKALGDPYGPGAEHWSIQGTFGAAVVVQRGAKLLSYPLAWGGGDVALGEPKPVEQVFRDAGGDEERSARRRRRLKLASL